MKRATWRSAPVGSGLTNLDFQYTVLKGGIRLAQILPGSGNRGIAINLVDSFVAGARSIPYDALSYTWGGSARNKTITCNGRRLAITETLYEALHRFRHPRNSVTMWIDQICICQERIVERNQQVQSMDKIYRGAEKVIVWLGDDYDDSKAGIALAKQLLSISRHRRVSSLTQTELDTHGLPGLGHRRWSALFSLLKRPWFFRAWIIQEVVLNPNVEVVLGSDTFTWSELEAVVALLEGPMPRVWQLDQAITASELPFSRINRIRLRHQRLIRTPTSPVGTAVIFDDASDQRPDLAVLDDGEEDPELLDLLMMSRGLGATDHRDKIYALLGLSNHHDLVADYSMTPESVFNSFAQQTVGIVTNMSSRRKAANLAMSSNDREVRRALILISCAGRHNQTLLDLQSWVPDWTIDLRSRPLIFGFGQRFAAGGHEVGVFDWQPESGLQLCGKLLDTVSVAGLVHLQYEPSSESGAVTSSHNDIQSWMQELRHIADARIARSPGSTMAMDAFLALRRELSLCRHGYYTGGVNRRRNKIFDDVDELDKATHNASHTLTLGPTRGRVAFTTTTGWLGLAPHGTREGDLVYVIMGADVPLILRPYEDAFELIGEAYVQGAMAGEIMQFESIPVVDVTLR